MASKIKVDTIENVAGSGNVSLGSGHNLVVPGNITGQGTTTLTDDLTVDTNTLFVDASTNRVGVGTTSPNNPLEISHTGSAGAGGLRIGDPSTIASDTGIYLRTTGDAVIGAAGGDIVFDTNMAVQEDMRIDSSGRITTPRQPSFMVRGNNANWVSVSSGSTAIIEFDGNTSHNVGSHYSTANDRFVAPVAGRYLFSVNAYVDTGGSSSDSSPYGYIRLRKNGSNIPGVHHIYGYLNAEDHDQAVGLTAILELSASDYIQVALQAAGGTVRHYGDSSVFFGHLLG